MATAVQSKQTTQPAEAQRVAPVRNLVPAADIYETESAFVVMLDVPGVRQQDLEVKIENDSLHIEGTALQQDNQKGPRRPYSALKYVRDFRLGSTLSRDDIKADLKRGVLTITLAKKPETQPRKIEISAGD